MIKPLSLITGAFLLASLLPAQVAPAAYRDHDQELDSGYRDNQGKGSQVVFSETLGAQDASWIQVHFGIVNLPLGSYLRITGLKDEVHQRLDAMSMEDYSYRSCYFNGEEVRVELIAAAGSKANRVEITGISAGEIAPETDTICGDLDDRVLSFDNRQGRTFPVGCTAWMIGPDMGLSAGHCASAGSNIFIHFNVPLSTSNGGLVQPHPDDQYPYNVMESMNEGVGKDWGAARVLPNSNTGLLPPQAYGEGWYELGPVPTQIGVDQIRITGYGSVASSSNLPRTHTQVQKTHIGALASTGSTALQYEADTTGGNSGSPVIDETSGMAVGIHTHGGCNPTAGANSGTRIDRNDLQAAIERLDPPDVLGESQSFGSSCPGSAGQGLLSISNMPLIGKTMRVNVGGVPAFQTGAMLIGDSDSNWAAAGVSLPLDLTPFGIPGCNLLVTPDRSIPADTGFGFVGKDIFLPDDESLVGKDFFIQFLYFDPPMGVFRLSNGSRFKIGG